MSPMRCFGIVLRLLVLDGAVSGVLALPGILSDGYSYPIPLPPPQFDEPSPSPPAVYLPPPPPLQDDFPQLDPTYLPPSVVYPPIGLPPLDDEVQPPFDDTIVIPSRPPPSNQYLPPPAGTSATSRLIPSPFRVVNMSCLDSRDGAGYFRTFLRTTNGSPSRIFPVMEASPADCLVTPALPDTFRIDLEGQRMADCGIRACGSRMCLTLRMATVRGLRLADDPLVTLQCQPQETIVSHTKHIRLNANSEQGRSSSRSVAVAAGGAQRRFETQLSLLRKSSGSDAFDQPVQQGSAVRLGDELLLRASVKDGDGWRSCRLGSVLVRSAASQRTVTLVDEDGCRSAAMRSVSPQQPQQVSPLVIQFPFRAFLFQGAAPADDLLLSVRMLGCLRPRDCVQSKTCDETPRNRVRRTATGNQTTTVAGNEEDQIVADWGTEFQFRVLPRDIVASNFNPAPSKSNINTNLLVLACMFVICAVLLCIIFTLIFKPTKHYH